LPKNVSVSDINDWMNIEFFQEGVTAPQLIATFKIMNGEMKAPVQEEPKTPENMEAPKGYSNAEEFIWGLLRNNPKMSLDDIDLELVTYDYSLTDRELRNAVDKVKADMAKPQEEKKPAENNNSNKQEPKPRWQHEQEMLQNLKNFFDEADGTGTAPPKTKDEIKAAWEDTMKRYSGLSAADVLDVVKDMPQYSKEELDVLREMAGEKKAPAQRDKLSDFVDVIHVGDAPKAAPTKYDAARQKMEKFDRLASKMDKYLKDNKGRMNVLPVDLFGAAAIVGANKILHGVIDFAEWSEQMMNEYGKELRLSLRALYTQSEDIINFSDDDLNEYMDSVGLSDFKEETPAAEETPKEQDSKKNGYQDPYFSTKAAKDELQALNEKQPPSVLIAFNHFWDAESNAVPGIQSTKKDKWDGDLYSVLLDRLNYKPKNVIIDSGAISFHNQGIDIGMNDLMDQYEVYEDSDDETIQEVAQQIFQDVVTMDWSAVNDMSPIFRYIAHLYKSGGFRYAFNLDTIGDNELSLLTFKLLNNMFPGKILPVFSAVKIVPKHKAAQAAWYVQSKQHPNRAIIPETDFHILNQYAKMADYIGIGGTAIEELVPKRNLRVELVNTVTSKFPEKDFHVLGTLDKRVVDQFENVKSSDGTAWIDKHGQWKQNGKNSKAEQMADNIDRLQNNLAPQSEEPKNEVTISSKHEIANLQQAGETAKKERKFVAFTNLQKPEIWQQAKEFGDMFPDFFVAPIYGYKRDENGKAIMQSIYFYPPEMWAGKPT
jgi:hypothetical protein